VVANVVSTKFMPSTMLAPAEITMELSKTLSPKRVIVCAPDIWGAVFMGVSNGSLCGKLQAQSTATPVRESRELGQLARISLDSSCHI
jgi:sulfite exporter TauE/SafE